MTAGAGRPVARPVGLRLLAAGLAGALLTGGGPSVRPSPSEDARVFWLGETPEARATAAARLLEDRGPFDDWYRGLRETPEYPPNVPTGRVNRFRIGPGGVPHPYAILVPEDYDPAHAYPVLVWLHGGVNRRPWAGPEALWENHERVADPDRIVVLPGGWSASAWWHDGQLDNVAAILRNVGRQYHIDTDRIHLLGISDGGSGAWYHAFRAQTPWASFLSFIGHPAVLASPTVGIDGQMYVTNLRNRPLMAVNGGRDRLYPTESVDPFIEMFRGYGVEILYRPHPDAGHDLTWMPEEEARIDSFLVATPRDPLPVRLEWETEDPARGRFAWIVIDEIGASADDPELPDRNEILMPGESEPYRVYPYRLPSGRVDVEREGNTVRIRSEGVRRLRVLVSAEVFDLGAPIRIEVNGRTAFEGVVEPSRRTLLEWAARDGDRSMLFAAEITIRP